MPPWSPEGHASVITYQGVGFTPSKQCREEKDSGAERVRDRLLTHAADSDSSNGVVPRPQGRFRVSATMDRFWDQLEVPDAATKERRRRISGSVPSFCRSAPATLLAGDAMVCP